MQPLIDGDIIRYEVGFGGQFKNDEDQIVARGWEGVQELLEMKIRNICEEVDATEEPIIYMTNDTVLNLFTAKIEEENNISKFAATLNDIDARDFLEEARNLINQLRGARG